MKPGENLSTIVNQEIQRIQAFRQGLALLKGIIENAPNGVLIVSSVDKESIAKLLSGTTNILESTIDLLKGIDGNANE